eukprot:m.58839 g.58839  ORF g.58839 m.58839 type:complete len:801 (+) comp11202_c0_seq2:300-2702(+)
MSDVNDYEEDFEEEDEVKQSGLRRRRSTKTKNKSGAPYLKPTAPKTDPRIASANFKQVTTLRNKVGEYQKLLEAAQNEIKTLTIVQQRQDKALTKFNAQEGDVPVALARKNEEIRVLDARVRKLKEKLQASDADKKTMSKNMTKMQDQIRDLQALVNKKKLRTRATLEQENTKLKTENEELRKTVIRLEKVMKFREKGSVGAQRLVSTSTFDPEEEEVTKLKKELLDVKKTLNEERRNSRRMSSVTLKETTVEPKTKEGKTSRTQEPVERKAKQPAKKRESNLNREKTMVVHRAVQPSKKNSDNKNSSPSKTKTSPSPRPPKAPKDDVKRRTISRNSTNPTPASSSHTPLPQPDENDEIMEEEDVFEATPSVHNDSSPEDMAEDVAQEEEVIEEDTTEEEAAERARSEAEAQRRLEEIRKEKEEQLALERVAREKEEAERRRVEEEARIQREQQEEAERKTRQMEDDLRAQKAAEARRKKDELLAKLAAIDADKKKETPQTDLLASLQPSPAPAVAPKQDDFFSHVKANSPTNMESSSSPAPAPKQDDFFSRIKAESPTNTTTQSPIPSRHNPPQPQPQTLPPTQPQATYHQEPEQPQQPLRQDTFTSPRRRQPDLSEPMLDNEPHVANNSSSAKTRATREQSENLYRGLPAQGPLQSQSRGNYELPDIVNKSNIKAELKQTNSTVGPRRRGITVDDMFSNDSSTSTTRNDTSLDMSPSKAAQPADAGLFPPIDANPRNGSGNSNTNSARRTNNRKQKGPGGASLAGFSGPRKMKRANKPAAKITTGWGADDDGIEAIAI